MMVPANAKDYWLGAHASSGGLGARIKAPRCQKLKKNHTMKNRNSIIWILGPRNNFAFLLRLF